MVKYTDWMGDTMTLPVVFTDEIGRESMYQFITIKDYLEYARKTEISEEEIQLYIKAFTDKGLDYKNCIMFFYRSAIYDLGNPNLIFDSKETYSTYLSDMNEEIGKIILINERDGMTSNATFSKPDAYVTLVSLDGYQAKIPVMNGEPFETMSYYLYAHPEMFEVWNEHFAHGNWSLEPGGEPFNTTGFVFNGDITLYQIPSE